MFDIIGFLNYVKQITKFNRWLKQTFNLVQIHLYRKNTTENVGLVFIEWSVINYHLSQTCTGTEI